jgi:ectoine hydroxylase-related dioxygenase (phytanoyl-CoA dioxygenase family)
MTNEENYAFDVGGFLIVRKILSPDELKACNEVIDEDGLESGDLPEPLVQLRDHTVLAEYLDALAYDGYGSQRAPDLIQTSQPTKLSCGSEPREHTHSYFHQNDVRFAQGIVAIWALTDVDADDGGFVFVPASHKSTVDPPANLIDGTDDLGLVDQVTLQAGDLFLCVEGVSSGVRPWKSERRLLAFTYTSDQAQRMEKPQVDPPAWLDELTPEQKAVVAPTGRPSAPPILETDGQEISLSKATGIHHPSTLIHNPDSGIDEKEFYHWDLCGHLVLKNVMDDEWLAAANEAVEQCSDQIEVGGDASKGSSVLAGSGVPSLRGLFELPKPHCDPFRRMIAHPAVVHRLNWMMGSGFVFRNARAICSVKGTSGHGLHSGSDPATPVRAYAQQNGRTYCEAINVAWQLRDVTEADGGFVCIPGSHKARYPLTEDLIQCNQTMDLVKHVEMEAGDVAIFLAAAQSHGAYPWKSDIDRRVVLMGYVSRNIA